LTIRKIMGVAILGVLLLGMAPAQDSTDSTDSKELLKQATFAIDTDYAVFNFVLLTNKTVDAIFSGPQKYAIRANANQTTVFYVHGVAKKDIDFEPAFEIEQNVRSIKTKPVNIKNFKAGPIKEGTKFEGLLQLIQKLNLYEPFTIKDEKMKYEEFQYSWEAIELMEG
jgi:hypothetical protein